jgi:hypothetical protein
MTLALNYLKHIGQSIVSQPHQLSMLEGKATFAYIIPIVLGDWWLRRDERKLRVVRSPVIRKLLYWVMAILILSKFSSNSSFIYFQF